MIAVMASRRAASDVRGHSANHDRHTMRIRIAYATDFSPASIVAFEHALALALATRARLDILHVRPRGADHDWQHFPRVREPLQRWGLLTGQDQPEAIEAKFGVRVAKVDIDHDDPRSGLAHFLLDHRPDMLVLSTHGWEGLDRLIHASVSEDVIRRTFLPTLLIGPASRSLIDPASGRMEIGRVLAPVVQPAPMAALKRGVDLLAPLGVTPDRLRLVMVDGGGDGGGQVHLDGASLAVERLAGQSVVDAILGVAAQWPADVILMPTTAKHGMLQTLRGTTTSHVVARAGCPVMTVPIIGH